MGMLSPLRRWLAGLHRPARENPASLGLAPTTDLATTPGCQLVLTTTTPAGKMRQYTLPLARFGPGGLVIGRGGGSDILLDDPTVSRRHARVWLQAGTLMIEDLGSHNGTQLAASPPCQPGVPMELDARAFRLGALMVTLNITDVTPYSSR